MWSDVAQSRILAASAATLTLDLFDADGEAPEPADSDTYTVQVVDSQGTDIKAAGTATDDSVDNKRSVGLSRSETASVDRITATWTEAGVTVATTQHDIVGGVYFTIAELREIPSASLKDATKHSTADLVADRTEVEYQFESVCNRAFVPRFASEFIESRGRHDLILDHPDLREVVWADYSTDGSTWTALTNLDRIQSNEAGIAHRGECWPCGLIRIGYRYGWDRPTPEIKRAALTAARYRRHQDKSGVDPRVTSMQADGVNMILATPGVRSWVTGVPGVDEVLNRPGIKFERIGVA